MADGTASRKGMRLAATTLVVRDRPGGLETLMLQRPATGSFPNAWVWPGGAVDAEDAPANVPVDELEERSARAAAKRELREETGLHAEAEELLPYALWSPPGDHHPRFRTWFFVADSVVGTPVAYEPEAVALEWVRPVDMLAAHAGGELTLVVPTWVTLSQLSESVSITQLRERVAAEPFEHYDTRLRDETVFCWFGDGAFDTETAPSVTRRHRLETATLPWRYLRDPS